LIQLPGKEWAPNKSKTTRSQVCSMAEYVLQDQGECSTLVYKSWAANIEDQLHYSSQNCLC
jgi:hypothetical protein